MNNRVPKFLFCLVALVITNAADSATPEPGPIERGLRIRLIVNQRPANEGGYEVQLDLLNTSDRPVTLRTKWRYDDEGDVKDYIEAATSIECVPPIASWSGGVAMGQRTSPQLEYVLKAGEVLTAQWKTNEKLLKNRVTNPNEVKNPVFPFPGLYSVHATLDVITSDSTVRLRSNEQLVSVGGSREMPRYTFGRLMHVTAAEKTAILDLGSLHKIAIGDQFSIGHPKSDHWRMTIKQVEPSYSIGDVEVLTRANYPNRADVPTPGMEAALFPKR